MRAVGNARFLAELGLAQVLPHSILYKCVRHLLQLKCGGFQFSTNMECLCQLLTICGSALDSAKGVALMDQFFARIQRILEQSSATLPNRLRFMLEDVVALRRNRWVPQHRGQRARVEEPQKRDTRSIFGNKEDLNTAAFRVVPMRLMHMDSDSSSLFRRDSDSGLSFGGASQVRGGGGGGGGGTSAVSRLGPVGLFDTGEAGRTGTGVPVEPSCLLGGGRTARGGTGGRGGDLNNLFCSVGTVSSSSRRRANGGEAGSGQQQQQQQQSAHASGGRRKASDSALTPSPAQPPPQLMSTNISLDFSAAAAGAGGKQPLFSQLGGSSCTNWRGANGGLDAAPGLSPGTGPVPVAVEPAGVPPNLPPRLLRKVQHERRWETSGPAANGPTASGTNTTPARTQTGPGAPAGVTQLMEAGRKANGGLGGRAAAGSGISLYPGGSRQAASLSAVSRGRGQLPPNLFEPAYLQRPGSGAAVVVTAKGKAAAAPQQQQQQQQQQHPGGQRSKAGGGRNVAGAGGGAAGGGGGGGVKEEASGVANSEDVKVKIEELVEQCYSGVEAEQLSRDDCVDLVRASRLLPRHGSQFVDAWIGRMLQRVDASRLTWYLGIMSDLRAPAVHLLTSDHVSGGLGQLLERLCELESSVGPRTVGLKSKLARVLASLLVLGRTASAELLSLRALCDLLSGGLHHPLFLLCLQQAAKGRAVLEESGQEDEEAMSWLLRLVEESEVALEKMLPASSRQMQDRVWEVFDERGLSFLLPRVKLARQLQHFLPDSLAEEEEEVAEAKANGQTEEKEEGEEGEQSVDELSNWLTSNFPPRLFHSQSLVCAFYSAATERVWSLGEGRAAVATGEAAKGGLTGKEKLLQERGWWRLVAEALKRQVAGCDGGPDSLALQVEAVHALQLVWHEMGQPKDFLLRCFMNLYELEVLEEDAFLAWREVVNPVYPDKGRALFQVNQWLTWLEEAEEEDSTDED